MDSHLHRDIDQISSRTWMLFSELLLLGCVSIGLFCYGSRQDLAKAIEDFQRLKTDHLAMSAMFPDLKGKYETVRKQRDAAVNANELLKNENESLAKTIRELNKSDRELANRIRDLKTRNEKLVATNDKLQVLNDEFAKSNKMLENENETLVNANEDLTHKNEILAKANQELENKNETLTKANQGFEDENEKLAKLYLELMKQKSDLNKDNATIKERIAKLVLNLDKLSKQAEEQMKLLAERDNELAEAKAARDKLASEKDDLIASNNQLKKDKEMLSKNLSARIATLTAKLKDQEKDSKETEKSKIALEDKARSLEMELAELNESLKKLQKENKDLVAGNAKEKGVRQELLGLKSRHQDKLGKVAVLVDTSGSMGTKAGDGSGKIGARWDVTQQMIRTWTKHLAADRIEVIQFHSVAEKPIGFDPQDERASQRMVNVMKGWSAGGTTATYEALQEAYKIQNLDAIILFTDGAPNPNTNASIYELVDQNRDRGIPINVVGLGQYFDEELGKFLLDLAEKSGGSFQAR